MHVECQTMHKVLQQPNRVSCQSVSRFFLAYACGQYLYIKLWYQKVATVYLHYYLAVFFRFSVSVHSHLAVQRQTLLTINQVEGIILISSLLP